MTTLVGDVGFNLFFRDPLICLSRGFTCGGRTELNRTDSIARNPLLICLGRGFTWGRFEKLCNKLNLLFSIVESLKDGISCSYIIWTEVCFMRILFLVRGEVMPMGPFVLFWCCSATTNGSECCIEPLLTFSISLETWGIMFPEFGA